MLCDRFIRKVGLSVFRTAVTGISQSRQLRGKPMRGGWKGLQGCRCSTKGRHGSVLAAQSGHLMGSACGPAQFGHLTTDGEPAEIMLNNVASQLGVPRRRLYDIINVMEAVEVSRVCFPSMISESPCFSGRGMCSLSNVALSSYTVQTRIPNTQTTIRQGSLQNACCGALPV